MKFITRTLVVGLMFVAGVALAAKATDPTVKAWQELMDSNGGAAKTLGGMASGEAAFDAAAAEAAKAQLIANAADIPVKFMTQAADPESKASPDIWKDWDEFAGKAKALGDAAAALDVSSLDTLKAGMGAVGGACKDCHTDYKMQ